jgi:hypothetical protein
VTGTSRYAILTHEQAGAHAGENRAAFAAAAREFQALREDPCVLDGARLEGLGTAVTVHRDGAKTLVTDGPYTDACAAAPNSDGSCPHAGSLFVSGT